VNEVDALKKELKKAQAEIESLKLQLSNVTLMLRKEMQETGKLPKPVAFSN
jgi:hypothetical protein